MIITDEIVRNIIAHNLPERKAITIEDRGVWIRHNFRITLDTDEIIYLSYTCCGNDWMPGWEIISNRKLLTTGAGATTSGKPFPNYLMKSKICENKPKDKTLHR